MKVGRTNEGQGWVDLGPAADSLSNTNHWDSYGGPRSAPSSLRDTDKRLDLRRPARVNGG